MSVAKCRWRSVYYRMGIHDEPTDPREAAKVWERRRRALEKAIASCELRLFLVLFLIAGESFESILKRVRSWKGFSKVTKKGVVGVVDLALRELESKLKIQEGCTDAIGSRTKSEW